MYKRDDKLTFSLKEFPITFLCDINLIKKNEELNGDLVLFLDNSMFWSGIMLKDDLKEVNKNIIKKINSIIIEITEIKNKENEKDLLKIEQKIYDNYVLKEMKIDKVNHLATKVFRTPYIYVTYNLYYY